MSIPGSLWKKNDPRMVFDEATHTYRLGDMVLTSVTQILAHAGLAQFDGPWFSDAVKARGTHLHTAIALDVEGDLDEDTLDEQLLGGVIGWRKFMADTDARIEFAEYPLCDPDTRTAGRLDYIITRPDPKHPSRKLRTVLDVKRGLYPCAAVQLAAYADMALPLYDTPALFSRAALVLPGDGTYRLHPFTDPTDRATWHAAVRVVNWRKEHLKELADVA